MNKNKKITKQVVIIASDTENTVPKTKEAMHGFTTHVWACGYAEMGKYEDDDCYVFNNLESMFDDWKNKYNGKNLTVYFHNLSYDGSLICDFLMNKRGYEWQQVKMREAVPENILTTLISDQGEWYSIRFNWKGLQITVKDSLKILPFKLEQIAKNLETHKRKLVGEIDYTIPRPVGWKITETEMRYIKNDILILSEALDKVRPYHLLDHFTISGCALADLKKKIGKKDWKLFFPQLDNEVDGFIRKSYRGGWCFVKKSIANKILRRRGRVYDVNSLYPWALHSSSEDETPRPYPIGAPHYFKGDALDSIIKADKCYFVRISVDMKTKEGHLPFLQIKHNRFKDNEYVEDTGGIVEMTLARPDFELIFEQYDIRCLEVLDGYWFDGKEGIFDKFVNYWYHTKEQATMQHNKVLRQIAKLHLNSCYGKFGESSNGNIKETERTAKGTIKLATIKQEKNTLYIPVAAYCTAYARGKTVRAAQANYEIFNYSDTDSIHLDDRGNVKGIKIDPVKLGYWDNETNYDMARFVRQKTYIEHTTQEENEDVSPYWNIKASGATDAVKERMLYKVEPGEELVRDEMDKVQNEKRTDEEIIERFTYGYYDTGKLSRHVVAGGAVLFPGTFRIKQ